MIRPDVYLFVLASYPTTHEQSVNRWRDDELLFFSAGGRWSPNWEKAVCFCKQAAAEIFMRRLAFKNRERAFVERVTGDFIPRYDAEAEVIE